MREAQKNDMADAEAIREAVMRPNMRFVPVKSAKQQSLLMLHRSRATGVQLAGPRVVSNPVRRPRPLPSAGDALPRDDHELCQVCT